MIKPFKKRFSLFIIFASLVLNAFVIFKLEGFTELPKLKKYISRSYYETIMENREDKQFLKNVDFILGKKAYDEQEYDRAIRYFSREIINHDKNALAHYYLGRANEERLAKGEIYYSEISKHYAKYIDLRPHGEHVEHAKLIVGQIYVAEGLKKRDTELLKTAESYLNSLDKKNNSVRMALGAIYLDAKNYDKAIDEFEKSANLTEGELELKYNSLGLAYIKKRMYQDAIRVLEIAVLIDPEDKYAQNNLGFSYVQINKFKEAKEHFIKALRIDPLYKNARRNLQWVEKQLRKKNQRLVKGERYSYHHFVEEKIQ
jgi:tetratricopeptide (TPR) repeat protein